jgi:hypothetical protein
MKALCTAIVSINQLPLTEDTLWLRLLGKGLTQEQAISEVLAFPKGDPRRDRILRLLASWKITLEISDPADDEDRGVVMVLSQAYLEWEKETEERGIQRGIQQGSQYERQITLEALFQARFGAIDEPLAAILSKLVALSVEDYQQLLLELPRLSQNDLVERFQE